MKILLISDNEVFGIGGGSLEEHKYYDGIKAFVDEYGGELRVLSIDKPFEESLISEQIYKKKIADVLSRVLGHSTYMYFVWKKYKEEVIKYAPDIVFLGRSRLGFIAKDIRRIMPHTKVVCNMENVEYDYIEGYFANKSSLFRITYIIFEKYCVRRDESMCIRYADAIDYLSQRDYKRTHELYSVNNQALEFILPICIEKPTNLTRQSELRNVVFIGSLSYDSNSQSLMSFIDDVWIPFFSSRNDLRLIVGGRNPSEILKKRLLALSNCTLYKNFTKIEDIIPIYSLIIAPIKKGAGMKVKVAESLSMGLAVAASDEALVGYEEAVAEINGVGLFRANSPLDFAKTINSYMELSSHQLNEVEEKNKSVYQKYYAFSRSRNTIQHVLLELVKK